MGSCTAALLIAGGSVIAVGLLLAIWGAMNTAMSVIWMSWMSRNVDDLPEAAGGLMVAVIQASILMGGVIGGFLLDLWAIEATFGGSVLLALVALAITGTGRHLLKPNTES
jgi:predicted MFS family arabinose efflux permease